MVIASSQMIRSVPGWTEDPTSMLRLPFEKYQRIRSSLPCSVAWMNNWSYADEVQRQGYIGQLSVVRQLRLQLVNGKPVLQNRPVDSTQSLFDDTLLGKEQTISPGHAYAWPEGAAQICCRLDLTMSPVNGSWPEVISLSVRGGGDYLTQLGFTPGSGCVFLDRVKCGPIPKEGDAWKARRYVSCNYAKSVSVSVFLDMGRLKCF